MVKQVGESARMNVQEKQGDTFLQWGWASESHALSNPNVWKCQQAPGMPRNLPATSLAIKKRKGEFSYTPGRAHPMPLACLQLPDFFRTQKQ